MSEHITMLQKSWMALFLIVVLFPCQLHAQSPKVEVTIGYLELVVPPPPLLSNLDKPPPDKGLAGVKLGIEDNSTTGRFLNHTYQLETGIEEDEEAFMKAARELLAKTPFVVINAPAGNIAKVSALPEARNAILFNASSKDNRLRNEGCARNLFHTIASRAMLADALSQFAMRKKWTNWAMIYGDKPGDGELAAAFRNSAGKFRINLVAEKQWVFDADMRRNASGEVPLFTQDFPDHDLLVIADEIGDFGRYVMYNTWLARPVGGSEGISPSTWSPAVEQHGAAQLQSRFAELSGRSMFDVDYAAWAAARSIGEAVTRTNGNKADVIRDYMLSDKFELAGFKGRKLTWRKWNGQLRQPVPLTHPRAIVAMAPLEGFLHRVNELDTLGVDEPETKCTAFGGEK